MVRVYTKMAQNQNGSDQKGRFGLIVWAVFDIRMGRFGLRPFWSFPHGVSGIWAYCRQFCFD